MIGTNIGKLFNPSIRANSSPSSLLTGLQAYYKFDENTGTTAADSSSNGITATLAGTTGSQWVAGKLGASAINLNGSDNSLSTALACPQGQNFTMAAWVNPTDFSGYMIITTFEGTSSPDFRIIQTTGKLEILVLGITSVGTSTVALTAGVWTHVAVTVDSLGNWNFYINGQPSGNGTNAQTYATSNTLVIGREAGFGHLFKGAMDEVGYWNRALSSSEISLLYNAGAGKQYPF